MNWKTFLAMLARDARVARRNFVPLMLQTFLQPLLFVLIFGRVMTGSGMMPPEYKSLLLPGIMALSMVYAVYGATPIVTALFFGLKAAVLAIVLQAVVRISQRGLKGTPLTMAPEQWNDEAKRKDRHAWLEQRLRSLAAGDRARIRRLTEDYRRLRRARAALIQIHRQILEGVDRLEQALLLPPPAPAQKRK